MPPPLGTTLCLCFCIHFVFSYHTKSDYYRNKDNFYSNYNELSGADQNHKLKLRHQSRFQNLDRVKSKLDSLSNDGGSYSKYRPHGWSLRSATTTTTTQSPDYLKLFSEDNDYDDEDENDDLNQEENDEVNYFDDEEETTEEKEDEKDDEESEDEDDIFSDFDEDVEVQDEGSTTTVKTVNVVAESQMSAFTAYKFAHFGTLNAVRESRQQMAALKSTSTSSKEAKFKAVMDHWNYVKNVTKCSSPKAKVIPVQQVHPNASVTYIPHCTVLHRCAEDTGCCGLDSTCQYKVREEVHLYVYTMPIGSRKMEAKKLLFYNDTDCECRSKYQKLPTVSQITSKGRRDIAVKSGSQLSESVQIRCSCPKEFSPRIRYGSKCFCSCELENKDCIRIKKGKEHLGIKDRMCLSSNVCGILECEYGQYLKWEGRCPRKDEKFRSTKSI